VVVKQPANLQNGRAKEEDADGEHVISYDGVAAGRAMGRMMV